MTEAADRVPALYASQAGVGTTGMVFLPPNPLDGSAWAFQVAHFSTWFRTLAVDLPGYGHSPRLRSPVTMAGLADAVWDAATAAGIDRAIVAGVSIGSALALHMRRLDPDRTIAIIMSGYGYSPEKDFAQRRIRGYRRGGLGYRRDHLREGFSPHFGTTALGSYLEGIAEDRAGLVDVASIVRLFEAHGQPDPEGLLDVHCPALILAGSADYAIERARALHERITGSELSVIEEAGHACNLERPWDWDARALEFIRRRTTVLDTS